jgi:hypothetical protein
MLSMLLITTAAALSGTEGDHQEGFVLLSPLPGAKYVRPETTILVNCEHPVDARDLQASVLKVSGSRTGSHDGTLIIAGTSTFLFKPTQPFDWNETVTVNLDMATLQPGVAKQQTVSYSFRTSRRKAPSITSFADEISNPGAQLPEEGTITGLTASAAVTDSVPSTFPLMTIFDRGDTSSGFLFLSNFDVPLTVKPYLMILRNDGSPVFYREMQNLCFDFKVQPNGQLTYYDTNDGVYYAMDSSYAVVDTFRAGNGYATDGHDLRILANGHALLMAADPEIVDMSKVIAGGDTAATVIGMIIQELDAQKNVVFQWRSWDHYQITDATHEILTSSIIDYVHGNSLELDADGNIIVSCRHMDEITKIDRQTGQILWRWGGKHNAFTFTNDTLGFSHQHAIRRIDNGNFTLFDNGNFHPFRYSRAVEYKLDVLKKTAKVVWQYRNSPSTYGTAMGNVQRLPNGNTLIGWGATNPSVTEVLPDGTKMYELRLPSKVFSYRAYRLAWKSSGLVNSLSSEPAEKARNFSLEQNYPNPFNPVTFIKYTIGGTRGWGLGVRDVSLIVYDVLGRQVAVLVNERKAPGNYEVRFDALGLSSGVYFYRLQAGDFVQTQKMILAK